MVFRIRFTRLEVDQLAVDDPVDFPAERRVIYLDPILSGSSRRLACLCTSAARRGYGREHVPDDCEILFDTLIHRDRGFKPTDVRPRVVAKFLERLAQGNLHKPPGDVSFSATQPRLHSA